MAGVLAHEIEGFAARRFGEFHIGADLAAEEGLNAADEIAVAAFLAGSIPFLGIPRTIERVLELTPAATLESIEQVLELDQQPRERAERVIAEYVALTGTH